MTGSNIHEPVVTRSRVRQRPEIGSWRQPWWLEAVLAVGLYELYNRVQAATASRLQVARAHGFKVIHVERDLHIAIEGRVNSFATAHLWLGLTAAYYYEAAHLLVTGTVLVFLWKRRPHAYPGLRNALIAINLLALIPFWLWPVAPPRLTGGGITDIMVQHNVLGAGHVHGGWVNLYAAMPSLHVAWASWCAGALVQTSRSRFRYLAWAYPVLTTAAVVATGNHYLLDAVAGFVLAAGALLLVQWVRSRREGDGFARRRVAKKSS